MKRKRDFAPSRKKRKERQVKLTPLRAANSNHEPNLYSMIPDGNLKNKWARSSRPLITQRTSVALNYLLSAFLIAERAMDFLPSFSLTTPFTSTVSATNGINFSFLFAE
jgi:hypothetical protein